jgi:deoxycytidylate deaminase
MPMAEVVSQSSTLVDLAVTAAVGFGSVLSTGYVGYIKLSTKFEDAQKHNTEAHARIETALEKQNGTLRNHATEIADLRGRCEERHK